MVVVPRTTTTYRHNFLHILLCCTGPLGNDNQGIGTWLLGRIIIKKTEIRTWRKVNTTESPCLSSYSTHSNCLPWNVPRVNWLKPPHPHKRGLVVYFRPRPHASGYFWIRNFFFPDSKISRPHVAKISGFASEFVGCIWTGPQFDHTKNNWDCKH